ncbi:MAG: energy-coupling factor ABC transporter permease [Candidatus Eisenbacteria bacterium]
MSHLHIPDGVLPLHLWLPGLVLAAILLLVAVGASRSQARSRVAYQGAIGALMLAAMAIELPLGPIDYHLSLVGPVGALLGAAAGFQVVFVVSAMLALIGHGGLTVVGLNALVLGAGAAVARPLATLFARRLGAPAALTLATALAQALSGGLWLAIIALEMRDSPRGAMLSDGPGRVVLLAGLALPLWLIGILVESLVAFGLGRFVARVRPDLLPGGVTPAVPRIAREPAA